jgi:hypothetical protein
LCLSALAALFGWPGRYRGWCGVVEGARGRPQAVLASPHGVCRSVHQISGECSRRPLSASVSHRPNQAGRVDGLGDLFECLTAFGPAVSLVVVRAGSQASRCPPGTGPPPGCAVQRLGGRVRRGDRWQLVSESSTLVRQTRLGRTSPWSVQRITAASAGLAGHGYAVVHLGTCLAVLVCAVVVCSTACVATHPGQGAQPAVLLQRGRQWYVRTREL